MKQAHFINFRYNFGYDTRRMVVGPRINWRGRLQFLPRGVILYYWA